MSKIKISLVLAVAACAITAVTAPAALAAKEFISSVAPVQLKDINKGNHVFETGGAGIVECETAESGGSANQLKAAQIKIPVKYTKCEVKVIGLFDGPATVSEAKYNFFASGKVENENEIKIVAKDLGEECKIKVPPKGNENLNKVEYANIGKSPKEIEVKATVEDITQTTEGGSNCGKSSSEGKYKGISTEKAEKGNIEVQ